MKKIVLSFCFILLTSILISQTTSHFEWVRQYKGANDVIGNSIAIDNNGNLFTTGTFYGSVDFDPSSAGKILNSSGQKDIFITKTNANGQLIWAQKIGSTGFDEGVAIAVDISGDIIVTGYFSGTADFNADATGAYNLSPKKDADIFILKLDNNGFFKWAKCIGGNYFDASSAIKTDGNGDIYTAGYFRDTVDFDAGNNVYQLIATGTNDTTHTDDVFILKIDDNGQFLWAHNMGGIKNDEAFGLDLDNNGSVYTTGIFQDQADFDPGVGNSQLISNGSSDIFISKLDVNGDFAWAKNVGGSYSDAGLAIVVNGIGNSYITGYYYDIVDFNPGVPVNSLKSIGNHDIFVLELDANGAYVNAKSMGGISEDVGIAIALDEFDNVYTCGYFWNACDFDPSNTKNALLSNGKQDIFISKLNSQFEYVWAKGYGNSSTDVATYIALNKNDDLYCTGYFNGAVDFNPNVSPQILTGAAYDAFLLKLTQCDPINLGITVANHLITSRETNATTYKWLDCKNGMQPIMGEINKNFNALMDGSYAVVITKGHCTDTSDCVTIGINSIHTNNIVSEIQVFPNPSKGHYYFYLNHPEKFSSYSIYNSQGQIIKTECKLNTKNEIALTDFANGIYYLQLIDNNQGRIGISIIKN